MTTPAERNFDTPDADLTPAVFAAPASVTPIGPRLVTGQFTTHAEEPAVAAENDDTTDSEEQFDSTDASDIDEEAACTSDDDFHRAELAKLDHRQPKLFYACAVLGDVEAPLKDFKPAPIMEWLQRLTGELPPRNRVSEAIAIWREWVSARKDGSEMPPKVSPKQASELDDVYRTVSLHRELPSWMTTSPWFSSREVTRHSAATSGVRKAPSPRQHHTRGDAQQLAHVDAPPASVTEPPTEPDTMNDDVTAAHNMPERPLPLHELAARGAAAREIQNDPNLFQDWSQAETKAERELAEWIRSQRRKARKRAWKARLDSEKDDLHTAGALRRADLRDQRTARKALAAHRRRTSPHAQLASLFNFQWATTLALGSVVAVGMIWSATNVQKNIASGLDAGDALFWFSYLLEGMISVCVLAIMIGAPKLEQYKVKPEYITAAEWALLAFTVVLNTYPYIQAREGFQVLVHSVAPVMIGVALLIHHALSSGYSKAIGKAAKEVPPDEDPLARPDVDDKEPAAGHTAGAYINADPLTELNPGSSE
ncbi:hypothetical protein [Nocardia asiatica]|uniref:hypothetical protein n=1 Tax=Nocardia asiatica TaxID=209252 RepID=UPI0002D643CC|nr:hypothetical protein [Nocardia asiatica]